MHMLPGAVVEKSGSTKDELVVTSSDIDLAGRSAALIHQRQGRGLSNRRSKVLFVEEEGHPEVPRWHLRELPWCEGGLREPRAEKGEGST